MLDRYLKKNVFPKETSLEERKKMAEAVQKNKNSIQVESTEDIQINKESTPGQVLDEITKGAEVDYTTNIYMAKRELNMTEKIQKINDEIDDLEGKLDSEKDERKIKEIYKSIQEKKDEIKGLLQKGAVDKEIIESN